MIQQRQDGLLPTDFSTQNNGPSLEQELPSQIPQPPVMENNPNEGIPM
jgi:hypothetical protein